MSDKNEDTNQTELLFKNKFPKTLALAYDQIMKQSLIFCMAHDILTIPLPANTSIVSCPSSTGSDTTPVGIRKLNDGQLSYLNDSTQFMLELLARLTGKGVFSLTPCYRNDLPDKTHLSMFYHAEFEIHGKLEDAMAFAEGYINTIAHRLMPYLRENKCKTRHIVDIASASKNEIFKRVTFDEACSIIGDKHVEYSEGFRKISRDAERELIKYFDGPVWLMYPDSLGTPFFQAFHENGHSSLAADLLMGQGETIGLGQRHTTTQDLERALQLHGLDSATYQAYIEMRKHRNLTTSGFGVGIERLMMYLFDRDDIRDFVILPRDNGKKPYL